MAEALYEKYNATISGIIGLITDVDNGGAKAIPSVVSRILTEIIPQMMVDVGKIRGLSGEEKKNLIIDAIDLSINATFTELNKLPEWANSNWDEELRKLLIVLVGPTINTFISVEKGELVFNKRPRIFCCC